MTQDEILRTWVSEDAAKLIEYLFEVSQIADDFVDADVDFDKNQAMHRLLMLSLVQIPTNVFYIKFSSWLMPIYSASITQWCASNIWEDSDQTMRSFAWAMRDVLELVIHQCVLLERGSEEALRVAIGVGHYFRNNEDAETIENFGVRK